MADSVAPSTIPVSTTTGSLSLSGQAAPVGEYAGVALRAGEKRYYHFRWHDLRHTWASWLRQNDAPTWVLQELGGWKSETMVRRYAHMSVKHLQPYADHLIFRADVGIPAKS
jgi:integrase